MQYSRFFTSWTGGRIFTALLIAATLMVTASSGMTVPVSAQDAYEQGVILDPINGVELVWPNGWLTEMGDGSDDTVADLQNQDGSLLIHIEGFALNGATVEQMATTVQQNSASAMESIADGGQVQVTSVFPSGTNSFGFVVNNDKDTWLTQVSQSTDPTKVVVTSVSAVTGSDLGAAVAQAQAIMLNDAPILQGFETLYPSTTAAAQPADSNEFIHGVLVDPLNSVTAIWPDGWSVKMGPGGGDPSVAELTAEDGAVIVNVAVYPTDGKTWDQLATEMETAFFDDQGANATSSVLVTESGFVILTDGDYGPRMLKGSATSDPTKYLFVLAANIQPGTDLMALSARINAITLNDAPALEGFEALLQS